MASADDFRRVDLGNSAANFQGQRDNAHPGGTVPSQRSGESRTQGSDGNGAGFWAHSPSP